MSAPVLITVFVDKDEWYPVHSVALPDKDRFDTGYPVSIFEAEFNDMRSVFDAFERVQVRLRVLHAIARRADRAAAAHAVTPQ